MKFFFSFIEISYIQYDMRPVRRRRHKKKKDNWNIHESERERKRKKKDGSLDRPGFDVAGGGRERRVKVPKPQVDV